MFYMEVWDLYDENKKLVQTLDYFFDEINI